MRLATLSILCAALALSACATPEPGEDHFGEAVQKMISSQSYPVTTKKKGGKEAPLLFEGSQLQRSIQTYRTRRPTRPDTPSLTPGHRE